MYNDKKQTVKRSSKRKNSLSYSEDELEDPVQFFASSSLSNQEEIFKLLASFSSLTSLHQNIFISQLVKRLSLEHIHLLFRKLNGLMTVNFLACLPVDVCYLILSFLHFHALHEVMLCCRQWSQLVQGSDFHWKFLFQRHKTAQCKCQRLLVEASKQSTLPHRMILQRHQRLKSNWNEGKYSLISVICRDVGVITTIQFDCDLIVLGTDTGQILAVNPKNGLIMHSFTGHTGGVWALHPQGDCLIAGSTDRTVRIWSIKGRKLLRTLI